MLKHPALLASLGGIFLLSGVARSEVSANSLFTDHCVLQRNLPLPIWGTADSDAAVTVRLGGQTVTTTAAHGRWKVWLKPMPACARPQTLAIESGSTQTIRDVLIGDVWVAGGQSNMERQLGLRPPQPAINGWKEAAAAANFPTIRQYYVPEQFAARPASDAQGRWTVCSPSTAPDFTAVGFFFARALIRTEHVPIGLLFSAWGGTAAESWVSEPQLRQSSDFRTEAQRAADHPLIPLAPQSTPAVLYNGMIAPLQPFPVTGVIWYQGESDCERSRPYLRLFPLLIADWRRGWGLGNIPFLYVQIAPSKYWTPDIRQAQLLALKAAPNTAMIGTADIGDANDMHPARKAPVGERLALAARALAYGEKVEYSGPLFQTLKIAGHQAVIAFTHVDGGLVAAGGALRGFTLAGADGKFVPAQARIAGKTVVVSSEAVPRPVAVTYGWSAAPDINLFNRAGLPASPFRTDDAWK